MSGGLGVGISLFIGLLVPAEVGDIGEPVCLRGVNISNETPLWRRVLGRADSEADLVCAVNLVGMCRIESRRVVWRVIVSENEDN